MAPAELDREDPAMQVTDPTQVLDRTVVDCDGTTIGTVTELYLDEHADRPGWIAVRTGWFGQHVSLVPLAGVAESDDVVVVPFSKSHVQDAPHHDPEMALSREEEATLFAYYGFPYAESPATTAEPHPGGSTAGQPSSVDYTTEDARRLETMLRTDAGTSGTRLRRSASRPGTGGPLPTSEVGDTATGEAASGSARASEEVTGSAAATGATVHGATGATVHGVTGAAAHRAAPVGDDQPPGRGAAIDVTEPATYPDDAIAADLRAEQDERERALRERQARGG
jgi:PRC-barrel domain